MCLLFATAWFIVSFPEFPIISRYLFIIEICASSLNFCNINLTTAVNETEDTELPTGCKVLFKFVTSHVAQFFDGDSVDKAVDSHVTSLGFNCGSY